MAQPAAISGTRPQRASLPIVVVLFLLMVSVPIYFTIGTTFLSPLRTFLMLSFVPLGIMLLTDRSLKLNLVDLLLVGFVLWSIIAIGPRHSSRIVEWGGALMLEVLGGYLVSRVCIRNRETFMAFCKVIGVVVAMTLPFAFSESLDGIPVIPDFLINVLDLQSVRDLSIDKRLGLERAQVLFEHPIHYGLWCSVAFSLTCVALAEETSLARRVVVSMAVFACCFLSLSSGAFLSVLMQIGLISWYWLFRNHKRRWILLFVLCGLTYVAIDLLSNRPPIRVFMSYATFSQHNAYWRATIFEWGMINVWSSPWIGIGLSDWLRPHWMRSASMDNYWLVQALRAGIPAFVFLAGSFSLMLYKLARRDFSADPQLNRLRRAYIFVIVGIMFSLATVHVWTNIQAYIYFIFGSGVWLLNAEPKGGGTELEPDPHLRRRVYSRGWKDSARPGPAPPPYTRFPGGRDRAVHKGVRLPA